MIALGDQILVVHRQLHRDPRQVDELPLDLIGVVLVLQVQVQQHVPVEAVAGDEQQHRNIGDDKQDR